MVSIKREAINDAFCYTKIYKMRGNCSWQIRNSFGQIYLYEPSSSCKNHIQRRQRKYSNKWLKRFLNKRNFTALSTFANEYTIEYDKKAKKLKNFRLFIIMDTDDCSETVKKEYISGGMFRGHVLQEYIIPIYNIRNLEDVMMKADIMTKRVKDSQKGSFYSRVFPINTEPRSIDTIQQIKALASKLKNVKQTNLLEFIEYCFAQIPNENLWDEEK